MYKLITDHFDTALFLAVDVCTSPFIGPFGARGGAAALEDLPALVARDLGVPVPESRRCVSADFRPVVGRAGVFCLSASTSSSLAGILRACAKNSFAGRFEMFSM